MTAAASVVVATEPIAIWISLDCLQPAVDQPRKVFHKEKLDLLTASIRARGRIVQPLVARPLEGGRYEIVCGERRWRAARAAGLTEAPVIVRELSDQEAFEESLAENLDREDMAPSDEVRAVARLADEHGVQETARRLGKPHTWVSKRKRIAEAPPFVLEFLEAGGSTDIEALYELSKLATTDVAAAESLIAEHAQGGRLREQVKLAARAARREDRDAGDDGPLPSDARGPDPDLSEESFRLEERTPPADDDDADVGDQAGDVDDKPPWLPSDAPELKEPFDANPAVLVTAVEARRAGHFVFATSNGEVIYELTPNARDQLQALLR